MEKNLFLVYGNISLKLIFLGQNFAVMYYLEYPEVVTFISNLKKYEMKYEIDLFEYQLKCLLNAEIQSSHLLLEMISHTRNEQLKQILTNLLETAGVHIRKLDGLCIELNIDPRGVNCKTMADIAETILNGLSLNPYDKFIISGIQRLEYYMLSRYESIYANLQHLPYPNISERIKEIRDRIAQAATGLNILTAFREKELPLPVRKRKVKAMA